MNVAEAVNQVEAAGGAFRLDGAKVRVWYPGETQRDQLVPQVSFLRAHRDETTAFLRARTVVPRMPPGVRLLAWNLKEPPVAIEACAVVTDPPLFARTTLEQLRKALAHPRRWVGWGAPQLIDRLAQVGVVVALEPKDEEIMGLGGYRVR
jgi:hypothetical protein